MLILGEGEERNKLEKLIKKLNLENKIFLVGYKPNIYKYLKKSEGFVLTSHWEDPGFVLIEAGFSNKIVLSSDCPNGPRELLNNNVNGFLYKKDSLVDFIEDLKKFKIQTSN